VHHTTVGIDLSDLFMQVGGWRYGGRGACVGAWGWHVSAGGGGLGANALALRRKPMRPPAPLSLSSPPSLFPRQVVAAAAPVGDDVLLKKMLYW
jgi:hypothetical protein